MIDIFLGDNYDKGLLKAYLEFIKKSASRELKYGTNYEGGLDVLIHSFNYNKEEVKELSSSWGSYKDDLVVFVDVNRVSEFINGDPIEISKIYSYIGGM